MSQNAVLPVLRKRQDLSSLPLNLPHSMVLKAVWNTPEPSQNCLPMFAWVTCVVPAGLFAAWPPRLKLKKKTIKKRSKCLHPRTLEFQAMIHRFIQIQLSCIHLDPIWGYFTVPRPGQGDARWSVEIWCRKCSRSFERPRQTLAETREGRPKKKLVLADI